MKYTSISELIEAYMDNDLLDDDCIIVDNNSTSIYVLNEDGEQEQVFDGGPPEEMLKNLLSYMGIPWRPA